MYQICHGTISPLHIYSVIYRKLSMDYVVGSRNQNMTFFNSPRFTPSVVAPKILTQNLKLYDLFKRSVNSVNSTKKVLIT